MQRKLPLKTMSTTQTNSSVATGVVSTAPLSNQIPVDLSKQWVRPPGVSDGGWAYAIRWRETLLHWNHPLDFFARVVDQNDQPVDDAKMEFRIVRVDEKTVLSQAFLHMKEGSEQDFQTKTLLSDEKGWISLTGISGKSLTAINLSKIGCISSYPSTYYVGMSYDPNGQRNPSGDIFVTNAWNPKVGYTFHLWKKGATEKLIQWDSGYRITRDKPEQIVSIFPASEGQALYADLVLKTPFAHPEITDGDRAYDRWIIIEAAQDAGIQETSMLYPYLAPQENYGREFRFMYQLGSRESDGWTKRFMSKLGMERYLPH